MTDDSSFHSLKKRLYERLIVELEGTLNVNSRDDMSMFESLFGELLSDERITLTRPERQRLFDQLVEEISGTSHV